MAVFETPPEKRVPLNLRVPISLRRSVEWLVKFWKEQARLEGGDPDKVDITYVCERLMKAGQGPAWEEFGGLPRSQEDFDELLRGLRSKPKK